MLGGVPQLWVTDQENPLPSGLLTCLRDSQKELVCRAKSTRRAVGMKQLKQIRGSLAVH